MIIGGGPGENGEKETNADDGTGMGGGGPEAARGARVDGVVAVRVGLAPLARESAGPVRARRGARLIELVTELLHEAVEVGGVVAMHDVRQLVAHGAHHVALVVEELRVVRRHPQPNFDAARRPPALPAVAHPRDARAALHAAAVLRAAAHLHQLVHGPVAVPEQRGEPRSSCSIFSACSAFGDFLLCRNRSTPVVAAIRRVYFSLGGGGRGERVPSDPFEWFLMN